MSDPEPVVYLPALEYVELFEGVEKRNSYEEAYIGEGIRYGDLKTKMLPPKNDSRLATNIM